MAQSKGLSKKHSPLQKIHYQAYRLDDRARKNLIKRLRTRIRKTEARSHRCNKRNARITRMFKKGNKDLPTVSYQRPDTGAISALKRLGVTV